MSRAAIPEPPRWRGGRRRGDGSVDVRVTALLMPASDPLGLPKCCGTERFRLAIRTSPTPAQKTEMNNVHTEIVQNREALWHWN